MTASTNHFQVKHAISAGTAKGARPGSGGWMFRFVTPDYRAPDKKMWVGLFATKAAATKAAREMMAAQDEARS